MPETPIDPREARAARAYLHRSPDSPESHADHRLLSVLRYLHIRPARSSPLDLVTTPSGGRSLTVQFSGPAAGTMTFTTEVRDVSPLEQRLVLVTITATVGLHRPGEPIPGQAAGPAA